VLGAVDLLEDGELGRRDLVEVAGDGLAMSSSGDMRGSRTSAT